MPGDRFLELAMAQDRHVLDVLFGDAREAVTVQDRSGHLIYANDRAAELTGYSSGVEMVNASLEDLVGRFEMVDDEGNPLPIESLPGRRVLAGLEAGEVTVGYRHKNSHHTRWSRLNASPIKNDAGEVVWAVNFFLDITEQMRHQEGEKILAQVSEILRTTPLARGPDFAGIAETLVPGLASWGGFHVLDDFNHLLATAGAFPESPDAHALVELMDQARISLGSDRIQARVISTGRREHIPAITTELLAEAEVEFGGDAVDLVQRLDLQSIVCVPLGAGSGPLGTMTLVRDKSEGEFDQHDLALIDAIAERIGVAVANSNLYRREHETAEALRRGLTPSSIPEIPGLEIAARYEPLAQIGQVGGDFYDVIAIDDKRHAIVVGDIEGKGLPAAAAVAIARQAMRTAISLETDPSVVIGQLNQAMGTEETPRMCTVVYLLLERRDDRFVATVTLAGHPPPLVLRSDGSITQTGIPCPPAGVVPTLDPKPVSVDLYPGDVVVLYTDGVSRRHMPPPETVASLGGTNSDESLDEFLRRVLDEFRAGEETVRDDIIMIALRVLGSAPVSAGVDLEEELATPIEETPSMAVALGSV